MRVYGKVIMEIQNEIDFCIQCISHKLLHKYCIYIKFLLFLQLNNFCIFHTKY